jgi:competence protein ComEA
VSISFTPAERRALYFLIALLAVGSGVQMYKRFNPSAAPSYTLEVDSVSVAAVGPFKNAAQAKLDSGIDPSTAPQEDLELLPGIGPGLARAIIAYREKNGAFRNADDLEKVPGLGPKTIERIRAHLRFP